MENNVVNNTEPQESQQPKLRQSMSKKIGKHLRATHYKLGIDGTYKSYLNYFFLI